MNNCLFEEKNGDEHVIRITLYKILPYWYNHLKSFLLLCTLYVCLWHAVMANDPRNPRSGCVRHLGMTHYIIKYTILSSYRCRSYYILYDAAIDSSRDIAVVLISLWYIRVFSSIVISYDVLYNHFILDIPQPMCVINRIHKHSQTSLFT